jgi:hypothetical protein
MTVAEKRPLMVAAKLPAFPDREIVCELLPIKTVALENERELKLEFLRVSWTGTDSPAVTDDRRKLSG